MLGAITRIAGCLAVIVVLFHDGVVLGLGQVTADQDAQVAVQAAAQSYRQNEDLQKAYDAAALSVASKGTDVDTATFKVDTGTGLITLTTYRDTSTMLAGRLHWFDKVTHPTSTASAAIDVKVP